jgi:hypothetical protein
MKPFDFINDINTGKKDLINGSDNPELAEKIYSPFLTNRSLSYFSDTVSLANEMNMRWQMDAKYQYAFLLGAVRKRKRFSKWHKSVPNDDLSQVMEYYGFSVDKAKSALKILSKSELTIIKNTLMKGGLKK